MHDIDIYRIDLNLLKAFSVLMETCSVTVAGERLGLAQSSMSHALRRLRDTFDDPLFVRSTAGMSPTPMALSLAEPITSALKSLQSALDIDATFDASSSRRCFRLLMTDVVEVVVLPRLLARMQVHAPRVEFSIQQLARNSYRDALEAGEAELALGDLPDKQFDFHQQPLFVQDTKVSWMCMMRNGHPLHKGMDLDDFLAAEHIAFASPTTGEKRIKRALGAKASRRKVALSLPQYMVAPLVISRTDLIAVLPRLISQIFVDMGLVTVAPLPFDLPDVEFRQFWHERTQYDPGCRWLRGEIASLFEAPPDH